MAGGAGRRSRRHVRARQSEAGNAMIEGGGVPTFRRMAIRTICQPKRRTRCRVNGIVGLLPGVQVAARSSTSCRRNLQTVIVVNVARSARHVCVSERQRKSKRCVIELAVRPLRDRVAGRAGCGIVRESGLDVVGNIATQGRSLVPVRQVTTNAVRRIQSVIVVDMARRAGRGARRHMRASKSKTRHAVIKRGSVPALCRVAVRAVRQGKRRSRRGVNGIVRLLPGV